MKMKNRLAIISVILISVPLLLLYINTPTNTVSQHISVSHNVISTYTTPDTPTSTSCQVVHIAVVCAGSKAVSDISVVIKSILFYCTSRIHLHLLTDDISYTILQTLLTTWNLPSLTYSLYNTTQIKDKLSWIDNIHYSGIYGLMKLEMSNILPDYVHQVIVLDTDIVLTTDITSLWNQFNNFKQHQFIGLVENLSDWYLNRNEWPALGRGYNTGVMLMKLNFMRAQNWEYEWNKITKINSPKYGPTLLADQDIINSVILANPVILFSLPCIWNIQISNRAELNTTCYNHQTAAAIHFNSPYKHHIMYPGINQMLNVEYFKEIYNMFNSIDGNLIKTRSPLSTSCLQQTQTEQEGVVIPGYNSDILSHCYNIEGVSRSGRGRLHINFYHLNTTQSTNDISIVTHLSAHRIHMISRLAELWSGPISLSLYLTDQEVQSFRDFLYNSPVLSGRDNIAYHILYKTGIHYPVNKLRNIALEHSLTDLVFLIDIDFLPGPDVYQAVRKYSHQLNISKTALVVPAFETSVFNLKIPADKTELISLIQQNLVHPFRMDIWAAGHNATDFNKFYTASQRYNITWQPNFEPYIVISRKITPKYDERFFGFGWNKVSHIMEVDATGVVMTVVPDCYIIHIPHAASLDISKFRTSNAYRRCAKTLKQEFQKDLSRKYGIRALKYLSND